ncbi:unnamed protein product, partial [Ectocarpus sp. 4 AP-2014]
LPPSELSGVSSTTTEAPGEGFLGLDLAFNCIGRAGTAALHRALASDATSVLFLELRGNEAKGSTERRDTTSLEPGNHRSDDSGGGGGSGVNNSNGIHTNSRGITETKTYDDHDDGVRNSVETPPLEVLLEEIGNVCAERRRERRLQSEHLQPHHRRCSAAADRQEPGASMSSPPRRTAEAVQRQRSTPQGVVLHPGRGRQPATGTATAAFGVDGDTGDSGSAHRLSCHGNSVAKPRPLEGALPMRGYYVGPLLDSSFDLLMLREPVADPTDQSLYVNRTRGKIEQRRALREQQHRDGCAGGVRGGGVGGAVGGGGRGGGGSNSRRGGHVQRGAAANAVAAAGNSAGEKTSAAPSAAQEKWTPVEPLRAGDLVSPITINLEREHVMAERRRLYQIDSDFAARKNARVAGCGRPNYSRSKLLTHKTKNAAFTKELLKQPPGVGGVAAKCPRGLRSHFLGLQNFEYDWGGGGRRGDGVAGT